MIDKLIKIHNNNLQRLYVEDTIFSEEGITIETFDKIKQIELENITELESERFLKTIIENKYLIVYYFIPFVSKKHWVKKDKNVFILQIIDKDVNSILDSGINRIDNLKAIDGVYYKKSLTIDDIHTIVNNEYDKL